MIWWTDLFIFVYGSGKKERALQLELHCSKIAVFKRHRKTIASSNCNFWKLSANWKRQTKKTRRNFYNKTCLLAGTVSFLLGCVFRWSSAMKLHFSWRSLKLKAGWSWLPFSISKKFFSKLKSFKFCKSCLMLTICAIILLVTFFLEVESLWIHYDNSFRF